MSLAKLNQGLDGAATKLGLDPIALKLALASDLLFGIPEIVSLELLAALAIPIGAVIAVITFVLQIKRGDNIFMALIKAAVVGAAIASPTPAATVLTTLAAGGAGGFFSPAQPDQDQDR
jgi:hypothetical protein